MRQALFYFALIYLVGQGGCVRNTVKSSRGNAKFESFSKAKKAIYQIFKDRQVTFYCGCDYERRQVRHARCGFKPKKATKRSHRTEIEHVVPAAAFGRSFSEWRSGHEKCTDKKGKTFRGRNCARRASVTFRRMEADLYNLVPAIGEVNGERRHFSMGLIEGEARAFGRCDVEIENRKIEPTPKIRGDIARIYLYMDWAYPGRGILNPARRRMFEAWSRTDPVDEWERTRVARIRKLQGNDNPFVR